MSNEKRRILEMVADGTITPSEAARLLEALGSSDFRRERPRTARKKTLIEATAMLSEIGPMIQETMGDMFRGKRKPEHFADMNFKDYQEFEKKIEEGQEIIIHGTIKTGKGISVSLEGASDDVLTASVDKDDDEARLQVAEKSGKIVLMWKSGALNVAIPSTASSVKVLTHGGNIDTSNVAVPLALHTMGGGISIHKPGSSFSAKTMGGKLNITLDGSWSENSKAKTMGGGIQISLQDGMNVVIDASTVGGSIDPGDIEHVILSSSGGMRGGSKMSVQYGDAESSPAKLAISTMGGDIVIEGEVDE